jgi:hypothetical protein
MTTTRYCACGDDALVGVGLPPVWLCLEHFIMYLSETARIWAGRLP